MATEKANESAKWREALMPLLNKVVVGLVALMAAATLYIERADKGRHDYSISKLETRVSVIESENAHTTSSIGELKKELSNVIENQNETNALLYKIIGRIDFAIEGKKKR